MEVIWGSNLGKQLGEATWGSNFVRPASRILVPAQTRHGIAAASDSRLAVLFVAVLFIQGAQAGVVNFSPIVLVFPLSSGRMLQCNHYCGRKKSKVKENGSKLRWSQLFIPTLRETPADAEVPSHQLLLRAGYIRPLAAGIYSYLFLGQRSLLKITAIVREEMDRIAQEFYLPALHPDTLWRESGRWDVMGETMFRLQDRGKRWLCLGMTHEEIMTDLARHEVRSYRQLPQIWYQIQNKFRDEPRPKGGLLRTRQFTMKDSYSFDLDEEGLGQSYQKHYETYCRIFERCGIEYVTVEAHSGSMGGSRSHEFMVLSETGGGPCSPLRGMRLCSQPGKSRL